MTIEDVIHQILQLGPNTLLAKIDIKSAFRLLPVNPVDRHLLAMEWHNLIYLDLCLSFELHSTPKLFNILADSLAWIKSILQKNPHSYHSIMMWCCLAFFGFLCSSKFTVLSQEAYDKEVHLSPSDLAVDNKAHPCLLRVTIK